MQKYIVHDPLAPRRQASEPQRSSDSIADAAYDVDFALWLDRQVGLLRDRKLDALDLENLIDELESTAKRDRRELASRFETLLMHLLKCQFQPQHKSGSWQSTLREQRSKIGRLLNDSPSLRKEVPSMVASIYADAVNRAALETGIPDAGFPPSCDYTVEQVLDPTFVP